MIKEMSRLGAARSPADGAQPRASGNVTAAGVDDEFNDFFDKGDIGDYEGGVAYSQPPSKLVAGPIEVPPSAPLDMAPLRARRAFFARVVAGVVVGCVSLIVAARFKPDSVHAVTRSPDRVQAVAEFVTPPAPSEVLLSPPPMPQPVAAERVPSPAQEVEEEHAALAPAEPTPAAEASVVPASQPPATSVKAGVPVKLVQADEKPVKATRPASKSHPAVRVRRAPLKRTFTAALAPTLRKTKPAVNSAPPTPKQSVAAFPVD
jgi:hypothetical protein